MTSFRAAVVAPDVTSSPRFDIDTHMALFFSYHVSGQSGEIVDNVLNDLHFNIFFYSTYDIVYHNYYHT